MPDSELYGLAIVEELESGERIFGCFVSHRWRNE